MRTRLGRLPSVPVTIAFYGLAWVAAVSFGDGAAVVGLVLVVAYGGYCWARPDHRADVWCAFLLPGGASALAADILDVDRLWIALPLLLVSLAWMTSIDVEARKRRRLVES
jgi:hypothetical protein